MMIELANGVAYLSSARELFFVTKRIVTNYFATSVMEVFRFNLESFYFDWNGFTVVVS